MDSALRSLGLTAALFAGAALMATTALALNHKNAGESPAKPALGAGGGTAKGTELFASRCGSCHTLGSAGTSGTVGPNLDELKPDKARVLAAIGTGGTGSGTMPKDLVVGRDAAAVAAFVASTAGK